MKSLFSSTQHAYVLWCNDLSSIYMLCWISKEVYDSLAPANWLGHWVCYANMVLWPSVWTEKRNEREGEMEIDQVGNGDGGRQRAGKGEEVIEREWEWQSEMERAEMGERSNSRSAVYLAHLFETAHYVQWTYGIYSNHCYSLIKSQW